LDGFVDFREADIQVVVNVTFSDCSVLFTFLENNSEDFLFEGELYI